MDEEQTEADPEQLTTPEEQAQLQAEHERFREQVREMIRQDVERFKKIEEGK